MARMIPTTTALITFEAAARLGGFSRAAEELCLTESAVSKQMAKLEAFLGVRLFDRVHGRISLTSAGKKYAAEVRKILDKLEAETQSIANYHQGRKELRIAALPTFSNKWLLPRLKNFSREHPDVVVNIKGRMDPFVFQKSEFDAAIHFDDPAWEGVRKVTLFSEELIAVVSPRHFDPSGWLDNPTGIPLLNKVTREDAWQRWFEGAGLKHPDPRSGPHYDSFATLIEAVRSGMGIALVPRLYVEHELKIGELVQPCSYTLRNEKTYMLILPDRDELPRSLQNFVDWLLLEAKQFRTGRNASGAEEPGKVSPGTRVEASMAPDDNGSHRRVGSNSRSLGNQGASQPRASHRRKPARIDGAASLLLHPDHYRNRV